MRFDDDTAVTAVTAGSDGAYAGTVADGRSTPRGPLGGYVMAIVLRAMQQAVGDDARRPGRSPSTFCARPRSVPSSSGRSSSAPGAR